MHPRPLRFLLLRAIAGVIAVFTLRPEIASAGYEPFIAEVMMTGASFCPKGWLPMNGQLLSIAQNQALFSLVQLQYGGDGHTTFALPLAPPFFTADHHQILSCIAVQGIFPAHP